MAKLISGFIVICAVLYGIFWVFGTHSVTVNPGENVVLVDRPYFGSGGGVRPEPMKEGRKIVWFTTTEYPVIVVPQSINVSFDDFTSSDNILLDFESTVQYKVTDPVRLIDKFGINWFDNNVRQQYTAIVRDQIKTNSMSDMMSSNTVAQTVDTNVTSSLRNLIKENNIPIEIINISLGRAKPNADVLHQMNETAAQQQRAKTLDAATIAEQNREKEQIAKAVADNAYRNAMQMSPQQYIELQRINKYSEACANSTTCIVSAAPDQSLVLPTK